MIKARDLIEILAKYPDADVTLRVDSFDGIEAHEVVDVTQYTNPDQEILVLSAGEHFFLVPKEPMQ